jgi:uncharacterized protein YecE (DUF72 family)
MSVESAVTLARFFVGTCGYAYLGDPPQGWTGCSTRGRKKRADELAYYARFFNFVEINSTFYRPASPTMARRWLERTPADFTFAGKVWQKFTHPIRLGDGEVRKKWRRFDRSDVERFIEGIGPLAEVGRLGRCYFNILRAFPAMRRISSGWRQRSLLSMFPRGSSNCAIEAGRQSSTN